MVKFISHLNPLNKISPRLIASVITSETYDTSCAVLGKQGAFLLSGKDCGSPTFRAFVIGIIAICKNNLSHLGDVSLLDVQFKDQLEKVDGNFQATIDRLGDFERIFDRNYNGKNYSYCFYLVMASTIRRFFAVESLDSNYIFRKPITQDEFWRATYRVESSEFSSSKLGDNIVLWNYHEEHLVYLNFYAAKLLNLLILTGDKASILSLLDSPLFKPEDSSSLASAITLAAAGTDRPLLEALYRVLLTVEPSHPSVKTAVAELRRFDLMAKAIIPMSEIAQMSGETFERILETALGRYQRLKSVVRTPPTRDYGADLIITTIDDTRIAVQCKRFQSKVNLKAVQEVVAAVKHYGCDLGVVVSNNGFLPSAQNLARSNGVELWDGDAVLGIFAGDYSFSAYI